MSFFDLFKKKKKKLSIEQLKWNKMWNLWAENKAASPYAELMTYESQVNNGGHAQFFDNVSDTADLPKTMSVLYAVLNGVLNEKLEKAYHAYSKADEENEPMEVLFDDCDDAFYEYESEIEKLLWEYANTIEL